MELRAGDWVQVKNPREIAETLDVNGTLDRLPFMPEMAKLCGQRFRVLRRAEKTCLEVAAGDYPIYEFTSSDLVVLDAPRCTGEAHDGCQRACTLFWKSSWLRKVEGKGTDCEAVPGDDEGLRSRLATMIGARYVCQSTELIKITRPLSRGRILLQCVNDVASGNRGAFEMLGLVLRPLLRKLTPWLRRRLVGNQKRTPVGTLNLRPGEWVVVKSPAEIAETLDHGGRNRGLVFNRPLCTFSGGKYQVRNRLDRMIMESTGEMRRMENTVILEGVNCLCENVLGGCPRQDPVYWREIWLKREN